MPSMTPKQFEFLSDVKELDDIQLGCLGVKLSVGKKEFRYKLRMQCLQRRWIRLEPRQDMWLETIYLTTRGLKSWRIAEKRFESLHSAA